jgi:hypothetical protein
MVLFSFCAFAVIHHGDVQVWLFYERNTRARTSRCALVRKEARANERMVGNTTPCLSFDQKRGNLFSLLPTQGGRPPYEDFVDGK